MLDILICCAIALEVQGSWTRLRPACPVSRQRTQEVVSGIISGTDSNEMRLAFGRIVDYPWLSELLARQASSSRHWDPKGGPGKDNPYVAAALRGMPEFTALFPGWQIASVSVEKVLVKPAAELPLPQGAPVSPSRRLPYDAILWVTLKKP
jgi:hypothetical protein